MPILMLSGAKDEVVPKEHMQALWEVVARRGEKKKLNGSEYEIGLKRAKYMEFEDGTHSKLDDLMPGVFFDYVSRRHLCAAGILDSCDEVYD
jgi:hypothetical protein